MSAQDSRVAELEQQVAALTAELTELRQQVQRRVAVVEDRSLLNAERIVKTHSSMQSMNERLKQVHGLARKVGLATGVVEKPAKKTKKAQ